MSIRKTLLEDLRAVKINVQDSVTMIRLGRHWLYAMIFYPNYACVFWYRVNHTLEKRRWPFRNLLRVWRFYRFGNDISPAAIIGTGLRLVHLTDIVIGDKVIIGKNVTIFNGVTLGAKAINFDMRMPVIGNNVFIGSGSKIIGGIAVGNNCIIGALTYCGKNIPDYSVAYGNPVRIIENQRIWNDPIWKFYWWK